MREKTGETNQGGPDYHRGGKGTKTGNVKEDDEKRGILLKPDVVQFERE